jgi:hypothetical protein
MYSLRATIITHFKNVGIMAVSHLFCNIKMVHVFQFRHSEQPITQRTYVKHRCDLN